MGLPSKNAVPGLPEARGRMSVTNGFFVCYGYPLASGWHGVICRRFSPCLYGFQENGLTRGNGPICRGLPENKAPWGVLLRG